MHIPLVLCNIISNYIDFKSKHKLKLACKSLNTICIKDLYNIDDKYVQKFDMKILSRYSKMTSLNLSYNTNIFDLNSFTKLKRLCAKGDVYCNISLLNLEYLDVTNNRNIIDVNHMTDLKDLVAGGDSGLDNKGIRNLDLIYLNVKGNIKVDYVKNMKNLKIYVPCGDILIKMFANNYNILRVESGMSGLAYSN